MKAIQIEAFGKSTEIVNVVDPGSLGGSARAIKG